MRVLITGAAGVLGQSVVSLVEQRGSTELHLTDMADLQTQHPFTRADLTRADQVAGLCDGVDEVVHIAAIHPWKGYSAEQYLDCNIKATHNLLDEALRSGVRRVIYTSSIAAMGFRPEDPTDLPIDESMPCRPVENLYGVTKHVGEQLCGMFCADGHMSFIALRPACFIPTPDDDPAFGLALLSTRVHIADVARAHALALGSSVRNEAILIAAEVPFTRENGPELIADARSVILRHFPDAARLAGMGIQLPATITSCYDVSKARRLLGWRPGVTFQTWLDRMLPA